MTPDVPEHDTTLVTLTYDELVRAVASHEGLHEKQVKNLRIIFTEVREGIARPTVQFNLDP